MIKVTFYGAIAPDDNGEPFVRTFPDRETWERVRTQLQWTYAKIDVEESPDMYLCKHCGQYHPVSNYHQKQNNAILEAS
jgi:hypothetical protein